MLLFMTFDESQSWLYEKNHELMQRQSRRRNFDPYFKDKLKFQCKECCTFNWSG